MPARYASEGIVVSDLSRPILDRTTQHGLEATRAGGSPFPDAPAEVIFENDALWFQARADGKPVECVIAFAALLGAGCIHGDETKEAFELKKEVRRFSAL